MQGLTQLRAELLAKQGASLASARSLLGLSQTVFARQLRDFAASRFDTLTTTPDKDMVARWERGGSDIGAEHRALIYKYLGEMEDMALEFSRRDLLGQFIGLAIFAGFDEVSLQKPPSAAVAAHQYMSQVILLLDDLCNLERHGVVEVDDLDEPERIALRARAHAALELLETRLVTRLLIELADGGRGDDRPTEVRSLLSEMTKAIKKLTLVTYPHRGRPSLRYRGGDDLHDLWHHANELRGSCFKSLRRALGIDAEGHPALRQPSG